MGCRLELETTLREVSSFIIKKEAPTGTSHGEKCLQALSHLRIFQDNICNKWELTHSENRHEIRIRSQCKDH